MKNNHRSPWAWVPTLYFAEGIPYVIAATTFSLIMYKRLGLSNTNAALYTSWLYLPWVIKPFWSPFVDIMKTKRWWIIAMQLLIGAGLAGVAFCIPLPFFLQSTLAILWLVAFSSATHDISADGFYMLALNENQQSLFVGIRSTFYRISMIVGQGALVMLAGHLENTSGLEPIVINVTNQQTQSINVEPIQSSQQGFSYLPQLSFGQTKIDASEAQRIKDSASTANISNGFVPQPTNVQTRQQEASAWQKHVSDPLKRKLTTLFNNKETTDGLSVSEAGGIATCDIRLKQAPEKEIVLNFRQTQGGKEITMVGNDRFTINKENWSQPILLTFQIDPKEKSIVSAEFTGSSGDIPFAWSITFYICAGLFIALALYHSRMLPKPASDKKATDSSSLKAFFSSFGSFFKKDGIKFAIAFILLFRLGEAQLTKIASPFLLDSIQDGGLGLSTGEIGFAYGTVGVLALTIGGILGGIAASKNGLRKWLFPMALSMNVPNLLYVYMSAAQPDNYLLVCSLVGIEQFGYGFGFTAFMLYLIYISRGTYSTSHYAICTGFMALGMMLPGMIAGWIQECVGYTNFFIWVCLCTIPGLILVKCMEIDPQFGKKEENSGK